VTSAGATNLEGAFSKDDMNATGQTGSKAAASQELGMSAEKSLKQSKEMMKSGATKEAEEEEIKKPAKVSDKRKADTDCKNAEFAKTLKERAENPPKDYF